MKRNINKIIYIGFIFMLMLISSPSLILNNSRSISTSIYIPTPLQKEISKDVENYYKTIDEHQVKVSITSKMLEESKNLLSSGSIESANNGYNEIKTEIDGLFKPGNINNKTLMVTTKDANNVRHYDYYNYELLQEPDILDYNTSFLTPARKVKRRIENLILLHNTTQDTKYLAALKKELVEVSKWANHWQSTQYIDTAEIAYAVCLGYDYAYNALQPGERYPIENRLLEAILLYGTEKSSGKVNKKNGNFKQVGNSGAGIIALTLIESSGDINLKVVDKDKDSITIEYPVKSNNNGSVKYEYKKTLWNVIENGKVKQRLAKITDPDMYKLLKNDIVTKNGKKYIPLRTYYAAIITKTVSYLPNVLSTEYMYSDGTYPEGRNYYFFGMRYLSYYLATLDNTLKKDYGILSFEGTSSKDKQNSKETLNNIVLNPVYTTSANSKNFDFGDAREKTNEPKLNEAKFEDDLFYLANLTAKNGYEDSAKVIYDYKKRTDSRWGFYSIMWYDEKKDPKDKIVDYEKVFEETIFKIGSDKARIKRLGVSAFTSSYTDKNGIYVAMKGGATQNNHTQLDLGTYVYDNLGVRWISDSGSAYKGKKYHDKNYLRWQYFVSRAEAHSTIVINKPDIIDKKDTGGKGDCLAADQWINAKATYTKFVTSDNSSIAILNLTDAYNKTNNNETETKKVKRNSNEVIRGLKLFYNKQIVLVQDEVKIQKLTDFYSILNINKSVYVEKVEDNVITLKNKKGGQKTIKIVLKSNNENVKFAKIKDITNNTGYINDFIKNPKNNTLVTLGLNDDSNQDGIIDINMNRVAVYLKNEKEKNTNFKYGVFYMSEDVYNSIDIDDLKLTDLDSWAIPAKPTITIYNGKKEVKNKDVIDGSAIIKIKTKWSKKDGEEIKYTLDDGKNWYTYDEKDEEDIERRTITEKEKHNISVTAYLQNKSGLQSDNATITNFVFTTNKTYNKENPSTAIVEEQEEKKDDSIELNLD